MVAVPLPRSTSTPGAAGFKGRWRMWYVEICDFRMSHPGCTNNDVAAALGKNPSTISLITNTDMYREYEAQRREEWQREHDGLLRQKLTGVTLKALDAMDQILEKKKDQIPLNLAREVVETGLDRLGFAPASAPSVIVNNTQQQVLIPNAVTPAALEEARLALRAVEQRRGAGLIESSVLEVEAEPQRLRGSDAEMIGRLDGADPSIDS